MHGHLPSYSSLVAAHRLGDRWLKDLVKVRLQVGGVGLNLFLLELACYPMSTESTYKEGHFRVNPTMNQCTASITRELKSLALSCPDPSKI